MKLGMMGGDEAVRNLILIVENEFEDLIVRGRAALMLGKLGDSRAVPPLIRALEAPGYQIALHAVQSLGMLGDQRAVAPLTQIAATGKDRMREAAIFSLHQLGIEPEPVPVLNNPSEDSQREPNR
jgi:HEAT repeat protein